jgi:hypothetical protein
MFLALGIDNKNKEIDGKNSEFKASRQMRHLIESDKERNPWSSHFFLPDRFLQYAIAKIFIDDADLCKQAASVVDIANIKAWQTYDAIISGKMEIYKDRQGTKYVPKRLSKYLPGREQALAYFFTQVLRHLWYGAASKNAIAYYAAVLGGEEVKQGISKIDRLGLWWKNLLFYQIKSKAEKRVDNVSFLSVWEDIKKALRERYPDRTDWVSFDDHGWVMTFDDTLIKRQIEVAKKTGCDVALQEKLGFAGIESWMSRELKTFYRN